MEAQEDRQLGCEDSSIEEAVAAIDGLLATCSEHHRHLQWLTQDPAAWSRARLQELLAGRGYSVMECTAQGAESSAKALHSLRHSFLLCMPDGALMQQRHAGRSAEPVVVDTDFRGQFEMAKPTRSYEAVMAAVPRVFVGTEARLQQLVKLICREMHRTFLDQGASIPPWRSKESLLSKWRLPRGVRQAEQARLSHALQPSAAANSKPPRRSVRAAWPAGHVHGVHNSEQPSFIRRPSEHRCADALRLPAGYADFVRAPLG